MDILRPDSPHDNPTKRCNGPCGRVLPATPEYFTRNKDGKYGLKSQCKHCQSEKNKAYRRTHPEVQQQYYEAHREEKLRYAAEYQAQHKEEKRAYNLKYGIEHRKEIRAYRAKHYQENKEKYKEQNARNYKLHSEARRLYAVRYRADHPEWVIQYREAHRDEHRHYDKRYQQEHREQKRLYHAQYRIDHYAELREWRKQYAQTEHAKRIHRAHTHKRKALKRNASGFHTALELEQQRKRQHNKCYWCHMKLFKDVWHADHIIPLSRGGSDAIDNIVIACPTCNMRKYNKLPHEWREGGRLL